MTNSVRWPTGRDVFAEALKRLTDLYADGHTVVVAFSAGKDSGVCLELAIMAARATGRLPVHVNMRDEEILFPGTFEYAERVAQRPEVDFRWMVANQPIVNVFNRRQPYWWTFDPLLDPTLWVREPPSWAIKTDVKNILGLISRETYPTPSDRDIFCVTGIRLQESITRLYSVYRAKGHLTKPNRLGVRNCRPIYDWTDGDVWRAVHEHGWDYNRAYDVMYRFDVPLRHMRIAPPTLNAAGAYTLDMARKAWPKWFDRVETRLPGIKTVAQFGIQSVSPYRRQHETWRDCFYRECIEDAPTEWIRQRAQVVLVTLLRAHTRHATTPFPEVKSCVSCVGSLGSWRNMARALYNGDPFALKVLDIGGLKPIDPEFFRPGSGTWGIGAPTW